LEGLYVLFVGEKMKKIRPCCDMGNGYKNMNILHQATGPLAQQQVKHHSKDLKTTCDTKAKKSRISIKNTPDCG